MDLSDKLYKLFLKSIEESNSIEDLDLSRISCTIHDGTSSHIIYVKSHISDMGSIDKQRFAIFFKDLIAEITNEQLDDIKKSIKEKVSIFEEIELEKKKKQQEKLVDRLLNNHPNK